MPLPDPPIPLFYDYVRATANGYFSALYDFTVSGIKHVPLRGPLILAANHISFYDPPAIGCKIPRHISYFARSSLFQGLLGNGLHKLEAIPVDPHNADIRSLKSIFRVLKSDGAVAIYPEGTRSFDGALMAPKPGAGMIACKSGAIVVPTRVFGTFEAFGRHHRVPSFGGHLHISYGRPMAPSEIDPGRDHPERYLEASRRIMKRISELNMPPIKAV